MERFLTPPILSGLQISMNYQFIELCRSEMFINIKMSISIKVEWNMNVLEVIST